jgi:hypothetical protein
LVVDAGGVVAVDLLAALEEGRVAPVGVGLVQRPAHAAKHLGNATQLLGVVVLFLCTSMRKASADLRPDRCDSLMVRP